MQKFIFLGIVSCLLFMTDTKNPDSSGYLQLIRAGNIGLSVQEAYKEVVSGNIPLAEFRKALTDGLEHCIREYSHTETDTFMDQVVENYKDYLSKLTSGHQVTLSLPCGNINVARE